MRNTISGQVFAEMIFCASAALDENRQQLNELNVFPVPDGDTGTNMSLTMSAAAAALHGRTPSAVGDAADTAASALLRGARGNSGVILSLLFRGLAKSLRGKAECSAADWAKAMCDGVDAAYKAVMKPAEGTVLTVSRCASEAAVERSKAGVTDIEELLTDALAVARETLAKTVDMNPVLKKAGVVDAGGQGYVVILNAMLLCRASSSPRLPRRRPRRARNSPRSTTRRSRSPTAPSSSSRVKKSAIRSCCAAFSRVSATRSCSWRTTTSSKSTSTRTRRAAR